MRPLDFLGRIKVKLGLVIVLAVVAAFVVNEVGINSGLSRNVRIAIAVVLALIMVQLLALGMTKPLREMAAAAQTIAKGRYGMRVSATSRDEVGELARAFNAMAADLGEVDRQRRELVANVSHELRTPITGLQAVLENVVDGVSPPDVDTLGTALAQTQRLGRLVAQLLDLSRLDSGARLIEPETLDLVSLCRQAVGEAALARDDVTVQSHVPPGTRLVADPGLLAQVLANLLDNAVRHSPPGGTVRLSAHTSGVDVEIAVVDGGPGIPASERARVFERFSRLDAGRAADAGGAGLGLAIAKEIVELHGGRIRIGDGPGCRMIVELPGLASPMECSLQAALETSPISETNEASKAFAAFESSEAFEASGSSASTGPHASGPEASPASAPGASASGKAAASEGWMLPGIGRAASSAPETAEAPVPAALTTESPVLGMAGAEPPVPEALTSASPVLGMAGAEPPVPEALTSASPVLGMVVAEPPGSEKTGSDVGSEAARAEVPGVRAEFLGVEVPAARLEVPGARAPGFDLADAVPVGSEAAGMRHHAADPETIMGTSASDATTSEDVDSEEVLDRAGSEVLPDPADSEEVAFGSRDAAEPADVDVEAAARSMSETSVSGVPPVSPNVPAASAPPPQPLRPSTPPQLPGSPVPPQPPGPPAYVPPSLFPRPELPEAPRWMLPAAAAGGLVAAVAMPYAPLGAGVVAGAVSLGAATLLALLPVVRRRLTPWAVGFGLLAYALVSVAVFRDADWLVTPSLLAGFGVASLAVSGAGTGWLGVIRGGLSVLLTLPPLPWFLSAPMKRLFKGRWLLSGLASAGLTVVLLGVFGLLFSSADAVFSTFARELLRAPDWTADLPYRTVLFVVFGLLVVAAVLVGLRPVVEPEAPNLRAPVSRMVWVVPLVGLNLLFAAFVAVQVTVLFGGNRRVLSTAGLTYAEYARSGFFELVTVSVFVLGVVAAAVVFLHLKGAADRWLLAGLLGPLCVFTLVVLASALHRLDLYTSAYGVTRLRAIVEATLWWLAAVFVLVLAAGAVRLARHRTAWFSRTFVLVTGLSVLAFAAWNPEARVAETQLSVRGVHRLDHDYLAGLGSEAVPALDRLPEPVRSCVLRDVVAANRLDRPDPWNGWNLARERARDVLRRHPVRADAECPDPAGRFAS
ncbi:DUF4153 domain-containing protein [Microtetraspora fusca]|uniref:DUF4153 domain-containing protein n=1 Tax=Microtetraspora fusca TaxID=1997 RepID=UPI000831BF2F|nr:DUF4153 domain-containing protein [Microtetraspora fusca]